VGFCYRRCSVAADRMGGSTSRLKAVKSCTAALCARTGAEFRRKEPSVQAWLRRRRVSGLLGVQAAFAVPVALRCSKCVSTARRTAGGARNCTDS
jgi:hypothetical protein